MSCLNSFTFGCTSILLGAALTACGAHSTTHSASSAARPGPPETASPHAAPRAHVLPDASPPSAHASTDNGAREESSRPGLGTEWGETQTSRVSSAPFEREDWARPVAVTSLHYNDSEGVRAMTRGDRLSSYASAGARTGAGSLSVRLLDADGFPLPSFDFGARTYVIGSHGSRYVIQIRNDTEQRFEAVATVDGLDVIDGRPGSFDKRGYLIQPLSTLEIEGFRQSADEVAAFRFGSVDQSYAARKGDARNVGVVGVAFFAERGARRLEDESRIRHGADPFPGRFATPP